MSALEETEIDCPYCGEKIGVQLDPSGGHRQDYVEDCQVCCRPIEIAVEFKAQGNFLIRADRDDRG